MLDFLNNLTHIFINILLPIFILITIGILLQRRFKLDLYTLAKINIYFLVPGIIFVKLYETEFILGLMMGVFGFCFLLMFILWLFAIIVSKLLKHESSMSAAFSNTVIFYNSANYGIPVNDLAFRQDPFAMSIQIFVLTVQNIVIFSYGVFRLKSLNGNKLDALLSYFKMPIIYALILGISFNALNISIPAPLMIAVSYISDALIGIALLTLGAQVAQLRFTKKIGAVSIGVLMRLILSPAIALFIIVLLGLEGILAQALLISSAMPTSVNSAVIAQEYKNEPEYASQGVLFSTILSSITVTLVIYVAMMLF